jgi:hypothetical protein
MKDVGKNGGLLFYWLRICFVKNHSSTSIVVFVFWRIKPRRNKSSDIDGCPNFPHHFFDHLHEKMKYTTNLNFAENPFVQCSTVEFCDFKLWWWDQKLQEFFKSLLKCYWWTNKLWVVGVVLDFSLFSSFKNTKDGFGVH